MDSGNYECSVTINSNSSLLYVEDSALVNESTTVSVQGINIHAFMYVCLYTLVSMFAIVLRSCKYRVTFLVHEACE